MTPERVESAHVRRRVTIGALLLGLRTALTQLLVLGGTVVLSRVLEPGDFGMYAVVRFALTFFEYFGDAGIAAALVRSPEPPSPAQAASAFTFQLMLAAGVVGIVWVAAPWVVMIWPSLPPTSAWLLRAMSLAFLCTAARVVPAIMLERSLKFGHIAVIETMQTLVFYVVAASFALSGAKAWTWAYAVLAQAIVGLVGVFLLSPWRPRFALVWPVLRPMIAFGIPFQAKGIVSFANSAVAPLYAGVALGPTPVGLINWGQTTAFFPLKVVEIVSRVSFPVFAKMQGAPARLREGLERALKPCALATGFCCALFFSLGENVTTIIYSTKWLPGIMALHAYSAVLLIGFVSPVIGAAFDALGRPQIIAGLSVVWTLVNWATVPWATNRWGMTGFVLGNCVHVVVGNALVLVVVRRLVPGIRWLGAVGPSAVGSGVAYLVGRFWVRSWANGPWSLTAGVVLLLSLAFATALALDPAMLRELRAVKRGEEP